MTKKMDRRKRNVGRGQQTTGQSHALLDYEGASLFLGISKGTLENWVSSGLYSVPHIRLGRLIRFRPASLAQWLAGRERNVEQPASTRPAIESAIVESSP